MTHDHRTLAIAAFNSVWDLLEKEGRSPEEDRLMLTRAHASLWHWLEAGTEVHHQRGVWMIARVYAELGWAAPARAFAEDAARRLEAQKDSFADFDFAFMEALWARIAAAEHNKTLAQGHLADARRLGQDLADEGDREAFFDQLKAGAWHGLEV